jgi:hypothetical protein
MSPATALENVGAPTPPTPATLPMRTRVNLMKAIMVERVSNAARARYALRASPNARQRKDRTITISLQEKEDPTAGWAKSGYRCGPTQDIEPIDRLTWQRPAKAIVAINGNN